MNVLFLDQFSELGGAQKCLLDLLPAIEERGWRASAALPGDGPLVKLLRARNVQVHPIPCGPYRSGSKGVVDMLTFARDWQQQVKVLRSLQFDLLYVNGPRMLAAAATAFGDRVPALFHTHSRIPSGPQSWLAGWSLRRLNATVAACAQAVAPRILRGRLKLISNGTEDMGYPASGSDRMVRGRRPRRPAGESYGLPNGGSRGARADQAVRPTEDWRIGMIGAIRPEKGQLEFLRAAALLAPDRTDLRFVLCGAPADPRGHYFRTIQKYLESLPVDLLGWRDDIATVLSELDLLVIASQSEGMPRVMLEAFSAGVPVVAFPAGGIPEVIRDGDTGFLVGEKTPEALAARLREVIQGGDLRRIATNARRAWEQKYTVETYRNNITALMESLASGRPAAFQTESRQSRR